MTEPRDNETAKGLTDQIKAHPGIALASGLALGVLASALLPKGAARRIAKGAVAAATVGTEAGMVLARHARETAASAAGEASEQLEKAGEGARKLRGRAVAASGNAASAGIDLTRAAIRLLGSLKR